jgi:crossover junction endodeoxyribonuclease RusA
MISFVVEGPPVPWQRCRGRNGHRYTPKKSRDYRKLVAWCALCAYGIQGNILRPVEMTLRVFWPDRRRRDLDNVTKQIGDALQGVAYRDDSQITAWHVTAEIDRERPRVEVEIREVGDG